MKTIIPFIIILALFAACSPKEKSNYEVLKEYFGATENGEKEFFETIDLGEVYIDTISIYENYSVGEDYFLYKLIVNDFDYFLIKVSDNEISVLLDSSQSFNITGLSHYSKSISDIFTEPENEEFIGIFNQYHTNESGQEVFDTSYAWDYNYKLYFEINNDTLLLHKSDRYKMTSYNTYYFTKEKGLVKTEIEYSDMIITQRLIEK